MKPFNANNKPPRSPFMAHNPEVHLTTMLDMVACDMVGHSGLRLKKFAELGSHFMQAIEREMIAGNYDPDAVKATLQSIKQGIDAQLEKGGK